MWVEIKRVQEVKESGRRKGKKGPHTIKAKEFTQHLPQTDQCPASLLAIASPSSIPLLLLSVMMGHPVFGQWSSSGPAVFSPTLTALDHPQVICWSRGRVRTREGLDVVQTLISNSQNIGVLSTLLYHKYKTQHHMGCCEEN